MQALASLLLEHAAQLISENMTFMVNFSGQTAAGQFALLCTNALLGMPIDTDMDTQYAAIFRLGGCM